MPPADPSSRRGVGAVLTAAVLFGTTGTTASFAPAAASAVSIGAARLVVGGITLLVALPWLGGSRRRALGLWRTPWGALAGLMTAVYQLAFFAAVASAGVALGTLVTIGSGPVLVGLLSWLVLRERPVASWWACTAIAVAGLALLTIDGTERPGVEPTGLLLALASALGYATYTVAAKRLMNAGVGSEDVMASAFGLGAIVLLPVLAVSGMAWLASASGIAVAGWLGIATIAIAYVLFGRGLRVLPAGPAATLVLAEPLVATLLGVGLLGEQLGAVGWLGAALVAVGLAFQGLMAARSRAADAPATPGVATA